MSRSRCTRVLGAPLPFLPTSLALAAVLAAGCQAGGHPEVVARLAATLEAWQKEAIASRVAVYVEEAEVSEEEMEKLRALGYVN